MSADLNKLATNAAGKLAPADIAIIAGLSAPEK
jgi:hypothetical protein